MLLKKLFKLVYYIKYFEFYLIKAKFTVQTDLNSLKWLEQLSKYGFEVIHKPGKFQKNANALSRIPQSKICNATQINRVIVDIIQKKQMNNSNISKVIKCIKNNNFPKTVQINANKELKTF